MANRLQLSEIYQARRYLLPSKGSPLKSVLSPYVSTGMSRLSVTSTKLVYLFASQELRLIYQHAMQRIVGVRC